MSEIITPRIEARDGFVFYHWRERTAERLGEAHIMTPEEAIVIGQQLIDAASHPDLPTFRTLAIAVRNALSRDGEPNHYTSEYSLADLRRLADQLLGLTDEPSDSEA